jgi:hypothetical protein
MRREHLVESLRKDLCIGRGRHEALHMVIDMKEMVGKCHGKEENEKVNKGRQTTNK